MNNDYGILININRHTNYDSLIILLKRGHRPLYRHPQAGNKLKTYEILTHWCKCRRVTPPKTVGDKQIGHG